MKTQEPGEHDARVVGTLPGPGRLPRPSGKPNGAPRRSRPTSVPLTEADAIEIWKRRRLGEAIHSIAAGFRVNPGRVAEVLNGTRFPEAERLSLI
jgi:hypothetical protein